MREEATSFEKKILFVMFKNSALNNLKEICH